jgi:hypothetical protein
MDEEMIGEKQGRQLDAARGFWQAMNFKHTNSTSVFRTPSILPLKTEIAKAQKPAA